MCIFCSIIKGDIPSKKVYEDEDTLAILDISQTTEGHTLVMPKKHYDNFLAMPTDEFGRLMEKTKEIAAKVIKNLDAKGCNILINTNEVAGQSVMHTHVHIIPRYDENDTIRISFTENQSDLDEVLKKINQD
ncbi:MAG: HIT family protein [Erysipelotrichaceae bacterium]|nr:HIT family protein [Erysipelotrichaceae bacterium]MBQ1482658.1 HIT family protein [Erysipelotrichaceae bacterium]